MISLPNSASKFAESPPSVTLSDGSKSHLDSDDESRENEDRVEMPSEQHSMTDCTSSLEVAAWALERAIQRENSFYLPCLEESISCNKSADHFFLTERSQVSGDNQDDLSLEEGLSNLMDKGETCSRPKMRQLTNDSAFGIYALVVVIWAVFLCVSYQLVHMQPNKFLPKPLSLDEPTLLSHQKPAESIPHQWGQQEAVAIWKPVHHIELPQSPMAIRSETTNNRHSTMFATDKQLESSISKGEVTFLGGNIRRIISVSSLKFIPSAFGAIGTRIRKLVSLLKQILRFSISLDIK